MKRAALSFAILMGLAACAGRVDTVGSMPPSSPKEVAVNNPIQAAWTTEFGAVPEESRFSAVIAG